MHHIWLDSYYIDRELWDHEIGFIEKGSLKITVNGETYIARENDVFLLRPGTRHTIEWNGENCSQPHVHFDFVKQPDSEKVGVSFLRREQMSPEQLTFFREDFYKANGIDVPVLLHVTNPAKVKTLLFEIIDEFTNNHPYAEAVMQGLMAQLIGELLRESAEKGLAQGSLEQQMNSVIMFLNENVDSNLSLPEIASHINVSEWTLIRLFNKTYNCSPMKYYNRLRHTRALGLLQYSILPVMEISDKMNFSEPQTFSRWFKSIDGNYPSFYRRK